MKTNDSANNTLFHEEQPLRLWWAWLPILILAGLAWYYFLVQIVFSTPVGTPPAPDAMVVVIWLIFGIVFPLFGYSVKLVTTVAMDSIVLRFVPLATRRIPLRDVAAYQMRRYRALAEYGRWGIRFGRHKKRAYTIGGDAGVELELTDGTRLLIGSQRAEELTGALGTAKDSQ